MRSYGDIPLSHRKHIEELESLEHWLNVHSSSTPALTMAKGMVCMACDYYSMQMEENGDRLLKVAESTCPGYFKGPFLIHIENDEEFAFLVAMLAQNPLCLQMMMSLGLEDE
jgi:hypothetical protein